MPFITLPEGILQQLPQKPQVEVVDGTLVVEWNHKRVEVNPKRLIFSEGVVARYDGTECRAKSLVLYLEDTERFGVAEGDVQIVDPDGTLRATKFVFDWRNRTGSATDVYGSAYRFSVSGREAVVESNRWRLSDAVLSPCAESPPLLEIRASSIEVTDAKRGVARRASLFFRGKRVVTVPTYRFNLGPRKEGIAFPTVSMNRDGTVGAAWASSFGLSRGLGLSASIQAFPQRPLGGALEFGYSPGNFRLPLSTFSERSPYGFLENVNNLSLRSEFEQITAQYRGLTIGGALNQGIPGRQTRDTLTAPLEVGFGLAEGNKTVGYAAQAKYQRIGYTDGPFRSRLSLGATVIGLESVNPRTDAFLRLDTESYLGSGDNYGWVSGTFGVSHSPSKWLRLSGSYTRAADTGNPFLQTDLPFTMESINTRFDLIGGSTKVSFLSKYDPRRSRFYDHELSLKQVAGCLEPFVIWRKFPSSLNFGIRLRTDDLFEAIDRRIRRQR
ncbi:MAG TPA: hypothetical protein PKA27_02775 [Fimbriimonadaceae bacterium]|nr:hypothetical protein [Fimbriimonadaceae bacterium]